MTATVVIYVLDTLPFKQGLWIVKVSAKEWREKKLDDQKRVKVKWPEWWLFVATTKPIPKGLIQCKVTSNFLEFGEIHNYSYLGPVIEGESDDSVSTTNKDIGPADAGRFADDIHDRIVSLSLQIYELDQQRNSLKQQRNDLLQQLKQ